MGASQHPGGPTGHDIPDLHLEEIRPRGSGVAGKARPINEDSLDMIETTKLSHWEIHRSNPQDFYLLHFFERSATDRKPMVSGDVGTQGFQDITHS